MLSRVAENIYWMARYVERAENTARLINVNANLLMDLPRAVAPGWDSLIAISGTDELYRQHHKGFTERDVTDWLIRDRRNLGSIRSSMAMARESCRTIRDVVPRSAWEHINESYLQAEEHMAAPLSKALRTEFLVDVVEWAQSLTGMLAGSMNHDEGYSFLRIGRNLERADMTTRIIDVRSMNLIGSEDELRPYDNIQWISVLKSLTAYHMYRRSVQARVKRADVLRFLFLNAEFPRSVMHCVRSVSDCLNALPHCDAPLKQVVKLQKSLAKEGFVKLGPVALSEYVDELQIALGGLHGTLYTTYFAPPSSLGFDEQAGAGQQQSQQSP